MIGRRLTLFYKLAIVWVILGSSENFTLDLQDVAVVISSIASAENDDLEACHNILQIRHLFGRIEIQ